MKLRLTERLLEWLFPSACPHEFAWPRKRPTGGHYQVCKLCGAEYLYDWISMRRIGRASALMGSQVAAMEQQNTEGSRMEARRFPRYRTDFPLPLHDPLERSLVGHCNIFSQSGLAGTVSCPLPVGSVVQLQLAVPMHPPLEPWAIVRDQHDLMHGFEFVFLSDAEIRSIQRLCDELAFQSATRASQP